jgi:putative iron-dependent peroxidase
VARDGHHAPATQHDAWLWISGAEPDVTAHTARLVALAVSGAAQLVEHREQFTYLGGRGVTRAIGRLANREMARAEVAIIPPGRRGAGGSHVLTMRWVHDLMASDRPSIAEQPRLIGRTKPDSGDLPADQKPPAAQISRIETSVGRPEIEIFRRSVLYRGVGEHGVYFGFQRRALALRPAARADVRNLLPRAARSLH